MKVPKIVHKSWRQPLSHLWSDPRLSTIQKQLQYFRFSPEAGNIFRAFSLPMSEIKVIMMALSPYQKVAADGTLYATGLAMGIPKNVVETQTQKSIRFALANDYSDIRSEDFDVTLESWHRQGVMLLNKSLTVTQNTSDAKEHIYPKDYGKFKWPGWEWFTSEVIKVIDEQCNSVVFAFLGAEAEKYAKLVSGRNYIELAPHPVARYYYLKSNPNKIVPEKIDFATCELFKRIDDITYHIDKTKINWFET